MRVFVAIDIDQSIRDALYRLAGQLRDKLNFSRSDASWVDPENIHVTLKFLGEIRDHQLKSVLAAVERAVTGQKSFEIGIGSVGCFVPRNPRVLWTAVTEGAEQLGKLQKRIDTELESVGFTPGKREFAAHLTLCRIKKPTAGKKINSVIADYRDISTGSVTADSVIVYQSELTGGGPIYTALAKYDLG